MNTKLLTATLILGAALSVNALAAQGVSCNVAINYDLNGTVLAPYSKSFVVNNTAAFVDDFSTNIRTKTFTATTQKDVKNNTVISINYFNDVGTFDNIDLRTDLILQDGKGTTSGSHTFSTSVGSSGNHTTTYSLTCKRL
jgi:hypothetical protein